MKKIVQNICAATIVALVLVACGGGGGGGTDPIKVVDTTLIPPPPPCCPPLPSLPPPFPPPPPNVSFDGLSTSVTKNQVIQGQANVEVAAFRIMWFGQPRPTISQMVFTSQSTDSLWAVFKDFKLVDNNGTDVRNEALYDVRRDDEKHEVTVNFYQAPWYPNDFGVVPKTYSLLGSLSPDVPVGTTSVFKLTAVQLHEAGKTAVFDVSGVRFEVVKIAGMGLPIITTSFNSNYTSTSDKLGMFLPMATFNATCPADNIFACSSVDVKFFATGVTDLSIVVDGIHFGASRGAYPEDTNSFYVSVSYALFPGQTKTFTVFSTVAQTNVWLTAADMVWTVGSIKVSPIIPVGPDNCNLFISDKKYCKG